MDLCAGLVLVCRVAGLEFGLNDILDIHDPKKESKSSMHKH